MAECTIFAGLSQEFSSISIAGFSPFSVQYCWRNTVKLLDILFLKSATSSWRPYVTWYRGVAAPLGSSATLKDFFHPRLRRPALFSA